MRYIIPLMSVPLILACSLAPAAVAADAPPVTGTATATTSMDTQAPANAPATPKSCYGVVTADRLNLRALPSETAEADYSGLVRGDTVKILAVELNWLFVSIDTRLGWVHGDYVDMDC